MRVERISCRPFVLVNSEPTIDAVKLQLTSKNTLIYVIVDEARSFPSHLRLPVELVLLEILRHVFTDYVQ